MLVDSRRHRRRHHAPRADDFSLDSHRRIYTAMLHLAEAGHAVDIVTVTEELLRKRKELDSIGGVAYLASFSEGLPRKLSIESYVRIVKDKSLMRQLMTVCDIGLIEASDQSRGSPRRPHQVVTSSPRSPTAPSPVASPISRPSSVTPSFPSTRFYEQGREVTGLATHYVEFDRMTSGLQDSELIIIAARPSMGKTAWAINIAENAAIRGGKTVAVFSLEMSKASLLRRMLASQALVSARKIQRACLCRDDRDKLVTGLEKLMESKIFIDDTPGITLAEMRAKARRLKQQQQGKLDLIVIDYLQLMTGTNTGSKSFENRTQEVSAISRGLKALAKEMKVPVVALSQLSRASEQRGGDKKPLLSDLRESGSIEQDADVVCFIHREEYYDRENEDLKGKAEIIIAKQRNGPTGSVHLAYLADYTRFENLQPGSDNY